LKRVITDSETREKLDVLRNTLPQITQAPVETSQTDGY
jgi:hypothetical protein